MNISKGQVKQRMLQTRHLWKTKRWFRIVVVGFGVMMVFSAGVDQGHQEMDPRQHGGPGSTVTEEQLHGKWDGILTDENGNAFCLVGWPCEDAGLDK